MNNYKTTLVHHKQAGGFNYLNDDVNVQKLANDDLGNVLLLC